MKITIDTEQKTLTWEESGKLETAPLYSDLAFELLSQQWLKVSWNQKYSYSFTWMGRPIIQLPEDMIRVQEVIYRVKPDVIIETGVAHGGSLIFYASLCKAMDRGRVVGIDIEIRERNRTAIEAHELSGLITLVEGSSTTSETVGRVKSLVRPGERVLVLLDSCHTREHVRAELEAYHSLVTPGSYIVATDGVMRDLHDVPLGQAGWLTDSPVSAVRDFLPDHPEFRLEQPPRLFSETTLTKNITYWPSAYLKRS